MKKYLAFLIALIFIPLTSFAASTFVTNDNIEITNQINGNLFVLGNNIDIERNVSGNLYALGESINVNGNIGGDLFTLGSSLTLSGTVRGNAHIATDLFNLENTISGDLFLASTSFNSTNRGQVRGESYITAREALFEGQFREDVFFVGDVANFAGTFFQSLNANLAKEINFADSAVVIGSLNYRFPEELPAEQIEPITRGEVNYTPTVFKSKNLASLETNLFSMWFLVILIVSLLITLIAPNLYTAITDISFENAGKHFLRGVITMLLWVIFMVIFAIGVITLPITLYMGLLMLFIYVAFFPIVGFALLVYAIKPKELNRITTFLYAAFGALILLLLQEIPVFGPAIILIEFLAFLGMLIAWKYRALEKLRKAKLV